MASDPIATYVGLRRAMRRRALVSLARNPAALWRRLTALPPPNPWLDELRRPRYLPPDLVEALSHLDRSAFTAFAVHPETAAWLYHKILDEQPRRVLECGSGVSTLALAAACQRLPRRGVEVVSLESNDAWLARTRMMLVELHLERCVRLVAAPLRPIAFAGRGYLGLHTDDVTGFAAEMLFVDAPPQRIGRIGVLPALRSLLGPGALVVLDDARRPHENECVIRWSAAGLASLKGYLAIGRGLALLEALVE